MSSPTVRLRGYLALHDLTRHSRYETGLFGTDQRIAYERKRRCSHDISLSRDIGMAINVRTVAQSKRLLFARLRLRLRLPSCLLQFVLVHLVQLRFPWPAAIRPNLVLGVPRGRSSAWLGVWLTKSEHARLRDEPIGHSSVLLLGSLG